MNPFNFLIISIGLAIVLSSVGLYIGHYYKLSLILAIIGLIIYTISVLTQRTLPIYLDYPMEYYKGFMSSIDRTDALKEYFGKNLSESQSRQIVYTGFRDGSFMKKFMDTRPPDRVITTFVSNIGSVEISSTLSYNSDRTGANKLINLQVGAFRNSMIKPNGLDYRLSGNIFVDLRAATLYCSNTLYNLYQHVDLCTQYVVKLREQIKDKILNFSEFDSLYRNLLSVIRSYWRGLVHHNILKRIKPFYDEVYVTLQYLAQTYPVAKDQYWEDKPHIFVECYRRVVRTENIIDAVRKYNERSRASSTITLKEYENQFAYEDMTYFKEILGDDKLYDDKLYDVLYRYQGRPVEEISHINIPYNKNARFPF